MFTFIHNLKRIHRVCHFRRRYRNECRRKTNKKKETLRKTFFGGRRQKMRLVHSTKIEKGRRPFAQKTRVCVCDICVPDDTLLYCAVECCVPPQRLGYFDFVLIADSWVEPYIRVFSYRLEFYQSEKFARIFRIATRKRNNGHSGYLWHLRFDDTLLAGSANRIIWHLRAVESGHFSDGAISP